MPSMTIERRLILFQIESKTKQGIKLMRPTVSAF